MVVINNDDRGRSAGASSSQNGTNTPKSTRQERPNLIQTLSPRLTGLSRVEAIKVLNAATGGANGLKIVKENEVYVFENYQIAIMRSATAETFIGQIDELAEAKFTIYPKIISSIPTNDGSSIVIIDHQFKSENLKGIDRALREGLMQRSLVNSFYNKLLKLLDDRNLVLKAEFAEDEGLTPVLVFDLESKSIVATDWFSLSIIDPGTKENWRKAMLEDLESR